MTTETAREAFDLHNPACRDNLRRALKHGSKWRRLWFWKLVWNDTVTRVCPHPK